MSSSSNRFHYAWIILIVGTSVVFGSLGLARFGYSMVLPSMQEGLHMGNAQAGALATANLIGYLALSVIGGALAARYGPRTVITIGLTIAGVGMMLTATAGGFVSAAVWRALVGVGSGVSNVPVMGLLSAWFGARRRGLATGVAVAGSSVALILLGATVPLIMTTYGQNGWRVSWYIFGGLTLVLAVAALLLLRNRPADVGQRPLGTNEGDPEGGRAADALHWGAVYRSGLVWHLGLVYVAFGFSYIIYMTFFVKFLMAEGGYSQSAAGGLFMTMGWFSLFCGLIWGGISDLTGRRWALVIVYLIQVVSFGLFGIRTGPLGLTVSAILFGLTAWSIPAIMAAGCGDILGGRLAPAGLGFITLFFGIGQAAGPSIAGAIADAAGSLHPAFLLAAAVSFLGAAGSWLLPGTSRGKHSQMLDCRT